MYRMYINMFFPINDFKKDDIWWFIIDVPLKSLLLLGDAPDSQTDLFINPTLGESWKKWNMALSKRRGQSSLQFLNFNVEEMFPCSNATMGKNTELLILRWISRKVKSCHRFLGFPEQYLVAHPTARKWVITPVINGISVGLIHWNHWGYNPRTIISRTGNHGWSIKNSIDDRIRWQRPSPIFRIGSLIRHCLFGGDWNHGILWLSIQLGME